MFLQGSLKEIFLLLLLTAGLLMTTFGFWLLDWLSLTLSSRWAWTLLIRWTWAHSQLLVLDPLSATRHGLTPSWVDVPARCINDKVRISFVPTSPRSSLTTSNDGVT